MAAIRTIEERRIWYSPKYSDKYVVKTRQFLRWVRRCRTEDDHGCLWRHLPDHYGAMWIRRNASSVTRAILEARILSNESVEIIAGKLGVGQGVVVWYERMFFDVRPRLAQQDFIVGEVILSDVGGTSLVATSHGIFLKFAGYFGGPDLLEWILSGGFDCDNANDLNGMLENLDRQARTIVQQKIVAAMHPLNQHDMLSAQELLKTFVKFSTEKNNADTLSVGQQDYLLNAEAFLSGIELTIGRGADDRRPAELREWDTTAVELDACRPPSLTEYPSRGACDKHEAIA